MVYFMGRAVPHHCHAIALEQSDDHDEEQAVSADCPICDIALPVVECHGFSVVLPSVATVGVTTMAQEVGRLRGLPASVPARGPPLS